MAVLKVKTALGIIQVGGPGTPQPGGGVAADVPNTWTADQTFTAGLLPLGTGANSIHIGAGNPANVSGASAIGIGVSAVASVSSGIAIGTSATASGTFGVAIGASAIASGASTTAVGRFAQATGGQSTAYGNGTQALAPSSVALGYTAAVDAVCTGSIAIGVGAAVTLTTLAFGDKAVAIGWNATAKEGRAVAVGPESRAWAISSTAIGRGANVYAGASHAVAIGRGAWVAADLGNSIAIGFSGANSATHVYFESGHTHKYVDPVGSVDIDRVPSLTPIVIHGFDAFDATVAPTNDVAGGPLVLAAGRGTGTADGGSVKLQVAPAGAVSNNIKNTLVSVVEAGVLGTARTLGFFGATPVVKPSGVAVSAAGIHAALVTLGLIAA